MMVAGSREGAVRGGTEWWGSASSFNGTARWPGGGTGEDGMTPETHAWVTSRRACLSVELEKVGTGTR